MTVSLKPLADLKNVTGKEVADIEAGRSIPLTEPSRRSFDVTSDDANTILFMERLTRATGVAPPGVADDTGIIIDYRDTEDFLEPVLKVFQIVVA